MGTTLSWMGMFGEARFHLERALELYSHPQEKTPTDALFRAGNTLASLGVALWPLGYPVQAVAAGRQALADARGSGHPVGIAITLWGVGLLETILGACPQSAAARADEAVAHCHEHLKMYEPWLRFQQGVLSVRRGDPARGIEIMQAAMAAAKEFDAELGRSVHFGHLATAYASLGKPEAGLDLLDEAIATVGETQERLFEAELHRLRGELLIGLGKTGEGRTALEQALAVARSQQACMWELRAATSLARLLAKENGRAEAHSRLASVYQWFTEGHNTPDLKDAKALLGELG